MLFQLIDNLFKEAKLVQTGTLSRKNKKGCRAAAESPLCFFLSYVGGECPLLGTDKPGFGSWVGGGENGENDKHNFNCVGKHLCGLICFKMP